jgi:hypothetical protein
LNVCWEAAHLEDIILCVSPSGDDVFVDGFINNQLKTLSFAYDSNDAEKDLKFILFGVGTLIEVDEIKISESKIEVVSTSTIYVT